MEQADKWKPYYMRKDKYSDGRQKILIAWYEDGVKKTLTLPKPEDLIQILQERRNSSRKIDVSGKKVKERQNRALSGPKVNDSLIPDWEDEDEKS